MEQELAGAMAQAQKQQAAQPQAGQPQGLAQQQAVAAPPRATDIISKPPFELYPDEDVAMFLINFEQLARLSRWNNMLTVEMCQICLRGKARDYYWSLRNRGTADFLTLKSQLIARFGETQYKWYSCLVQLLAKLENRKQGKDETVRDYVDDMRRIFDKVNYPEEAQIHRFMSNLNDKYRDKDVNRIPRNLTEAVCNVPDSVTLGLTT